jgi:hypothetical protein
VSIRHVLGKLGSGQLVVDRHRSHVHKGVSQELLAEALAQIWINLSVAHAVCESEFERVIGEKTCVLTSESDEIVYAKRRDRDRDEYTRFVKNRDPEPCNTVVVILKKDENEDVYVLLSAFVGKWLVPEPGDPKATRGSDLFWKDHALVWGSFSVDEATMTTKSPW